MAPRYCWTWLVGGVAVLVAVLATYPLVTRLADSIPVPYENCSYQICADDLLCVWIAGEGGRRLYTDPLHLFDANILHPFRHTLAFSESMLAAGAVVAPLNALTGNPILGYNLYYLATVALSFLGSFLLVREITGDPWAGLVAGLLFALAADRWEFRGHLPAVSVHWVPFVCYAVTRLLTRPTIGRALVFGVTLVAQMHASAYHGLMLVFLLVPWALTLLLCGPWPLRSWFLAGGVGSVAVMFGALPFLPYLAVRNEMKYEPARIFPVSASRYLDPYMFPSRYLDSVLAGNHTIIHSPLPLLVVAIAVLALGFRRSSAQRPLGQGAQQIAALVFFVVAAAVSLGDTINVPLLSNVHGPLFYLQNVPGFASMRTSDRFSLLAAFGDSTAAGIAAAAIFRRLRNHVGRAAVLLVLITLVLFDTRVLREPMPLLRLPTPEDVPQVYLWLAGTPPDTTVLELPYSTWGGDALDMIYSLYHGRRLFNGYSAIMPRFLDVLGGFPDEASIRALQDAGVQYVIVHEDRLLKGEWDYVLGRIAQYPDLAVNHFEQAVVFQIPAGAPPVPVTGVEVDSQQWQVRASAPGAQQACDQDQTTHWTVSTAQDSSFTVDLGTEVFVTDVILRLGPHFQEYPRYYTVLASTNGSSWQAIGGEEPTLPPFASYRRDHLNLEMPLRINPRTARYLDIRVHATGPGIFWWFNSSGSWGLHELKVYATSQSVPGPGSITSPCNQTPLVEQRLESGALTQANCAGGELDSGLKCAKRPASEQP